MLRTHTCGELTEKHTGSEATLCGWVDTCRDHGGVTFIDLRDRHGKTQLVIDPTLKSTMPDVLKSEDCIRVRGSVRSRPKGTENPKLPTGRIEIAVSSVEILNRSEALPFEVVKSQDTNEELRMKYRYLDLRNPAVQKNLFVRHRIYQIIRRVLDEQSFIEVETPILTKSTPEGARDYLVPSRLNPGEFYALPQSPQLFKQILMVSGFDRYFQIARCFRDEDLRADRQPEFTQLDLEMSFLEQEDIFRVIESVLGAIFTDVMKTPLKPFPRLTYHDAMSRYGTDKPDLRFGMEIRDVSELAAQSSFNVFKTALAGGKGAVLALAIPKAEASRKDIDTLTEFVRGEGGGGMAYFKVEAEGRLDSPIAKFFETPLQKKLAESLKAATGDLIVFVADEKHKAQKIAGMLRLQVARWKNLIPAGTFHFSWITDFPLFKYNAEEKRWDSEHHPFTSPHMDDWEKHHASGELGRIRSSAYDLVLNGNEIASGSIRIHQRELQKEIFKTIGLDEKDAERRFGFLLKALDFGAPPHGGIALGIDRIVTILLGLSSIREVIAFPKNQKAVCPMTEAPSPVDDRQLKEIGVKIR